MKSDVVALKGATADRLKRLLGTVDGEPAPPGRSARAPRVCVVQCTSDTPAGTLLHAAGAISYSAVVTHDFDRELFPRNVAACWLTLWGDNGIPAIPKRGRSYLAVLTGRIDLDGTGERQRAFAVATCCDEEGPGSVPSGLIGSDVSGASGWEGSGWVGLSGDSGGGSFPADPPTTTDPYRVIDVLCVSGVTFVVYARERYTLSGGSVTSELYDYTWSTAGCCDCEETSAGSVDPGESGCEGGYCDEYAVAGTTVTRTAANCYVWQGGEYTLWVNSSDPTNNQWSVARTTSGTFPTGSGYVWTTASPKTWDGQLSRSFAPANTFGDYATPESAIVVSCGGDSQECALDTTTLYVSTVSSGGPNGCLGSDLTNDPLSSDSATQASVTHGGGEKLYSGGCTDDACGWSIVVTCVGDGTYTISRVAEYSGPPTITGLISSGGPPGSGTFHIQSTYTDEDSDCTGNPTETTVHVRDFTI